MLFTKLNACDLHSSPISGEFDVHNKLVEAEPYPQSTDMFCCSNYFLLVQKVNCYLEIFTDEQE